MLHTHKRGALTRQLKKTCTAANMLFGVNVLENRVIMRKDEGEERRSW